MRIGPTREDRHLLPTTHVDEHDITVYSRIKPPFLDLDLSAFADVMTEVSTYPFIMRPGGFFRQMIFCSSTQELRDLIPIKGKEGMKWLLVLEHSVRHDGSWTPGASTKLGLTEATQ